MAERNYDDIIGLSRPVSKKHPPMSARDRAGQFAPFAALTGYGDAVAEAARETDGCPEQDSFRAAMLDGALRRIAGQPQDSVRVTLTVFEKDGRKEGGRCRTVTGTVRSVDAAAACLVLTDGTAVSFGDLLRISFF